jgi:glycosyltransferase involved in cell wall biosynthesis
MSRSDGIKVLLADNTFTFGGAITSAAHLVNGLHALGVETVVATGQTQDLLAPLFPHSTTHTVDLRLPWIHGDPFVDEPTPEAVRALGPVRRILRGLWWDGVVEVRMARLYTDLARRHGCDLIHLNNTPDSQLAPALAAKALGIPCVAHYRGPPGSLDPSLGLAIRVHLPDHHIAISRFIADQATSMLTPQDRLSIVHDAIDLDVFHPGERDPKIRAELSVPDEAVLVGHFGRVIWWKGTQQFIRAFARVAAELPEAWAIIVGDASDDDPGYMDQVRAEAADLGIADRTVFSGYRSDVPDLMRACDVVAHSSITPEPFGMVIAEAMACGVPVVAANAGGPLEIVRDGVDGLLADPWDAKAFGAALETLMADPALRATMGANALERARGHFSKERYAREVLAVYDRVLGRETTA